MKITIEPTVESNNLAEKSPKISIETDTDDLTCGEVATLFRGVLIAYGFHEKTVDEYILSDYNNFGQDLEKKD